MHMVVIIKVVQSGWTNSAASRYSSCSVERVIRLLVLYGVVRRKKTHRGCLLPTLRRRGVEHAQRLSKAVRSTHCTKPTAPPTQTRPRRPWPRGAVCCLNGVRSTSVETRTRCPPDGGRSLPTALNQGQPSPPKKTRPLLAPQQAHPPPWDMATPRGDDTRSPSLPNGFADGPRP